MTTTTCRVIRHDQQTCGTPCTGFACKACIAKLRRLLAGGDSTPSVLSLAHELSMLATGQTAVYRANGRAVTDEEFADIEEEYAWRRVLLPPHLRTHEGRVTLPTGALMVNEHARDLLAALTNTIVTWARHIAETRGVDLDVDTLHGHVTWLVDNLEAVRFDEAAPDLIRDIDQAHHYAMRAVDRQPSRIFYGLCHAKLPGGGICERELYAEPNATVIECDGWEPWEPGKRPAPGCGAKHDEIDREVWRRAQFESSNWTIDEGLAHAPLFLAPHTKLPARKVVIEAARAGRMPIKSMSMTDPPEPRFLGADLLAVITAWRPRAYAPRPNHHKRRMAG